MDAESDDNTPAIAFPLCHEDIHVYACVLRNNMHILGKITFQVSTHVHILIQEAFTHIFMDAEHNETTPTIQCYGPKEDSDVYSTHISRKTFEKIVESISRNSYKISRFVKYC